MPRNRLTEQAIANIKDADYVELVKNNGVWNVHLCKEDECITLSNKLGHPVVYSSKENAKRSISGQNPDLTFKIKSQFSN